jgi:hypothetical protein
MWEVWQMLSKSVTSGKWFWHGKEITKDEYDRIKTIIDARPEAPASFAYRLTETLDWELYELPVVEDEEELTETEALEILLGGTV